MDCLFCQIAKKEKQADVVYESEEIIVFKDINPKASFHVLVVPKKHIDSVKEAGEEDKDLLGNLFLTARKVAEENNLDSYNLKVNVGREAGQLVDHLHVHLLSDKK